METTLVYDIDTALRLLAANPRPVKLCQPQGDRMEWLPKVPAEAATILLRTGDGFFTPVGNTRRVLWLQAAEVLPEHPAPLYQTPWGEREWDNSWWDDRAVIRHFGKPRPGTGCEWKELRLVLNHRAYGGHR